VCIFWCLERDTVTTVNWIVASCYRNQSVASRLLTLRFPTVCIFNLLCTFYKGFYFHIRVTFYVSSHKNSYSVWIQSTGLHWTRYKHSAPISNSSVLLPKFLQLIISIWLRFKFLMCEIHKRHPLYDAESVCTRRRLKNTRIFQRDLLMFIAGQHGDRALYVLNFRITGLINDLLQQDMGNVL
jgi:hypothetical protein